MNAAADFLVLPAGVKALVLVMFWPVIWGGALMIVALAGDIVKQKNTSRAARGVLVPRS